MENCGRDDLKSMKLSFFNSLALAVAEDRSIKRAQKQKRKLDRLANMHEHAQKQKRRPDWSTEWLTDVHISGNKNK